MGRRRRKKKTHVEQVDDGTAKAPRAFVIKMGSVGPYVGAVMRDFRKMMEPNVATRLKTTGSNKLRDFVSVAGTLGVSHMAIFTLADMSPVLRLMRVPHGPTATMRIESYSTVGDVTRAQSRPVTPSPQMMQAPPLVVLHGFSQKSKRRELSLMAVMFQSMFPTLNIQTVKLNECKRVVYVHYEETDDTFVIRHYMIQVRPVGLGRAVRTIVESHLPSLGSLHDISEYILDEKALARGAAKAKAKDAARAKGSASGAGSGSGSGSEAGESSYTSDSASTAVPFGSAARSSCSDSVSGPASAPGFGSGSALSGGGSASGIGVNEGRTDAPLSMMGQGGRSEGEGPRQSAVRLKELGPRLKLSLLKIEAGLAEGSVLYHRFVTMSEADAKARAKAKESKRQGKIRRKKEQERNVARKEAAIEAKRRARRERKKSNKMPDTAKNLSNSDESEDVDEAEYYRQAVGEEPDPDMFSGRTDTDRKKKRMGFIPARWKNRKRKAPGAEPGRGGGRYSRGGGSSGGKSVSFAKSTKRPKRR